VIVGAGLAGAATAHALVARGVRDVTVLEREPVPGVHASGRSAALSRRLEHDPVLAELAREGVDFCARPPAGFAAAPLLRVTGGLLLGDGPTLAALGAAAAQARSAGLAVERWSPREARARVPVLAGAPALAGWRCGDEQAKYPRALVRRRGACDEMPIRRRQMQKAHAGGPRTVAIDERSSLN